MTFVLIHRKQLFLLVLIALLLTATWTTARASHVAITPDPAAPDTVKSDGLCSLREAIITANKDADSTGDCEFDNGADRIVLDAGAIYTLTKDDNGQENSSSSGDLDITADLLIEGNGATITAPPGFKNRIIHVLSGSVIIRDLTISGGGPKRDGGGILNQSDLTLEQVTIKSNVSGGSGGGIRNEGTLFVDSSTLYGNEAGGDGGAIENTGTLDLANSTLSQNRSEGHGGGLANSAGNASLNNSTVAENTADIDNRQGGDGGGITQTAGTVTLGNTLLAYNIDNSSGGAPSDCSGAIDSTGFNLIQAVDCSISLANNLLGSDPLLEPLGDYGGTTLTHALSAASPAIDAGNPATPGSGADTCETTDQRGVARPLGLACDIGAYESARPTTPSIIRVIGVDLNGTGGGSIDGLVPGFPNGSFTLKLYTGGTCDDAINSGTLFETITDLATDDDGYFFEDLSSELIVNPLTPTFVVASVTNNANGEVSGLSECVVASMGNDSWPTALPLTENSIPHQQYLDVFGQSLWFKFSVEPGSQLIVTLTGLPVNYDLTVYKDIAAAYSDITSTEDIERLSAEFAPSAFSPSAFSPSAFSPSAFSPSAFSPSAFSPSAFSPSAFSPSAFSPSAFSPSAFSPSAFSPSAFSPSAFSPDAWSPSAFSPSAFSPSAFSPSAFSPSAFSPSAFSPSAFSAAQMQSLVGVSAFDGTSGEGLVLNTWNNSGDYYVRVRGREGAFSLDAPFTLGIVVHLGDCGLVDTSLPSTSHDPASENVENVKTLIITDFSRLEGTAQEKADLQTSIDVLIDHDLHQEVMGHHIDIGNGFDDRIDAARVEALDHADCPFAMNQFADSIKRVVDLYRPKGLQYIVLAGNDAAIPFFRYPDEAYLGPEEQYVPPVLDFTTSQASLRLNYVLSQDAYGTQENVSFGSYALPIPDLAVGRLVETAGEIKGLIDAFLDGTDAGVVPTPTSSLVTGYDFLEDAANAIQIEFETSLGAGLQTKPLITPDHLSPESNDLLVWSADDLADAFLTERHDLVFLAGHFSAASALAADYRTSLTTLDLLGSPVDLTNSIIFSAGCHSGYNIVNNHAVPSVTFQPDWAQAFAQKGATFVGGTGYQYGDTDFIEYSERIYLEFSRQLRASGAVAVGNALVAAKQAYLRSTPQMRGLHAKALLEATLFGLPMLSVEMPGDAYVPEDLDALPSSLKNLQNYDPDGNPATDPSPGATLKLNFTEGPISPLFNPLHVTELRDYDNPVPPLDYSVVSASHLSAKDGIFTSPVEPILPLEVFDASVPGKVLRGVGFMGGAYEDLQGILPLTGAATTEIRGVHAPFHTSVFYPVRIWGVNYFDTLSSSGGGTTQLAVTPAQFRSSATDPKIGTLRKFTSIDFRLYYSDYAVADEQSGQSALAAPPTIVSVNSSVNGQEIEFQVHVVDNPAAGIQEVWVTYTDISGSAGGTWQSIPLTQNAVDTTLWEGTFTATNPGNLRFISQAANGLGLVTMATNLGSYYIPGAEAGQGSATSLVVSEETPDGGKYGTQVEVSATLSDESGAVFGKVVTFFLGSVGRAAVTDEFGLATATLPVLALPGANEVVATFGGDAEFGPSEGSSLFNIIKRDTQLSLTDLDDPGGIANDNFLIEATLAEAFPTGRTLPELTIVFNVTGNGLSYYRTVITDYLGRALLGEIPLPPGDYSVNAFFSGSSHGHPFSYEDERYNPSSATFEDPFTLINTKPDVESEAYTLAEDVPLTTIIDETQNINEGVLANDTDVDDQILTAILDTSEYAFGAENGEVQLNLDGTFTYTPDDHFNGVDSFTYFAFDTIENSDPVVVQLTVIPVNDLPVAENDSYSVDEDFVLDVVQPGVLSNDTDPDFNDTPPDELKAVLDSGPSYGNLTFNEDGSFSYTPNDNFDAIDSFTYYVEDREPASSNVATVTINVIAQNDIPVADDDSYSTNEDQELIIAAPGVLDGDTDIDGDPLSTVLVSDVSNGKLSLSSDGAFSYMPDLNFHGEDSFTYRASDGFAESLAATVTIEVIAQNDTPIADDDSYSTSEDQELIVAAPGVLHGDSDIDGDSLTVSHSTDVSNGTLILNADGSFRYTPDLNFNGADSFTYVASDGQAVSATATVNIDVIAINDRPVANNDMYSAVEDTALTRSAPGVLANDSDIEGNPLTAAIAAGPAHGSLVLNSDGSFTYTPNSDFAGTDWFTYVANDANTDSADATVTITVTPVNDAPVAGDDSYEVDEDNELVVAAPGVLDGDSDIDGDSLDAVLVSGVSNGTLSLSSEGGFSYMPSPEFNGEDSFTYKASDGTLESSIARVTITVRSINDPPDCSGVTVDTSFLWPPDGKMFTVTLSGWTDVDDDGRTSLIITDVYQDEGLTRKFDAQFNGRSNEAKLRAERDGNLDGRVYHIFWKVDDLDGGVCGDEYTGDPNIGALIRVPVIHDNSLIDFIDQGPLVNSLGVE